MTNINKIMTVIACLRSVTDRPNHMRRGIAPSGEVPHRIYHYYNTSRQCVSFPKESVAGHDFVGESI